MALKGLTVQHHSWISICWSLKIIVQSLLMFLQSKWYLMTLFFFRYGLITKTVQNLGFIVFLRGQRVTQRSMSRSSPIKPLSGSRTIKRPNFHKEISLNCKEEIFLWLIYLFIETYYNCLFGNSVVRFVKLPNLKCYWIWFRSSTARLKYIKDSSFFSVTWH